MFDLRGIDYSPSRNQPANHAARKLNLVRPEPEQVKYGMERHRIKNTQENGGAHQYFSQFIEIHQHGCWNEVASNGEKQWPLERLNLFY